MKHSDGGRLRSSTSEQGISLVEMLVAMLVMAVVFAALGTFLITSIATQTSNELRTQAVQLAQQSVEEGRALPWELTGFYVDDSAAATTCGIAGGPVVTLPLPVAPATKSPRVPTAGSKTVVVNGTTYTRTVCYRWIDDPGDGIGTADLDSNTKDVKRVETTLTWQVKGQTKTHTAFGLRAPTASEVAPKVPGSATPFGIVEVTPPPAEANSAGIDDQGKLTSPLTFSAKTTTGVSIVQLRWTDATGAQQLRTLSSAGSSTNWTITLPAGDGPFAAILTTFTFSANSPTGEVSNQATSVAFSTTPGSLTIDDLRAVPNSIDVNTAGISAKAFTVTAKTNSTISSATLRYRNRSGAVVGISMTIDNSQQASYTFPLGSGAFADGVTAMSVSVNGLGGTATSATNVTFVPPAIPPVQVLAATAGPSLCVSNNNGAVLRSTTLTVDVQGIGGAPDVVKLELNALGTAPKTVDAIFAAQGATDSTYRFTIPVADANLRNWKNVRSLSVTVLATRKSDNTQATRKFDFTLFERNGGNECPVS